jgi:hypothetical protein
VMGCTALAPTLPEVGILRMGLHSRVNCSTSHVGHNQVWHSVNSMGCRRVCYI